MSYKKAFILLITAGLLLLSFHRHTTEVELQEQVSNLYRKGLQQFRHDLYQMQQIPEEQPEKLKKAFLQCRISYKKIEFLIAYSESNRVRALNGPNLLSDEFDGGASQELQPHGLQVIEHLVYNRPDSAYQHCMQELALLMEETAFLLNRNSENLNAADFSNLVWDALRMEIYRIEALGITGFDVPESEHAIPETAAALDGMWQCIALYKPAFRGPAGKKHFAAGRELFRGATEYARARPDFAAFDRLFFIRTYLHPISAWLLDTRHMLGYRATAQVRPINGEARHLFATDIWNLSYFGIQLSGSRVQLGKKLFYDTRLSVNDTRSCASCHNPAKGFADGLKKPLNIYGNRTLPRNTPTLWNAALQTRLFYDSRSSRLEKQAIDVIHNPEEMGGNMEQIALLLKQDSSYRRLFAAAYGGRIDRQSISAALAAYTGSLISVNSRFDRYMRGEPVSLSGSEKNGFNLFAGKARCATCHFMPLFNGLLPPYYRQTESEIIGVPADAATPTLVDPDRGRFAYTGRPVHMYSFKTPDIRNAILSAPYMHNGVFNTLEDVLEFYNRGGGAGQGMQLPGQTLSPEPLGLSKSEMHDIIQFIHALSDTTAPLTTQ